MKTILELVAPYRKALVAFVVSAIIGWLSKHGLSADISLGDALRIVVDGAAGAVLIWATPNKSTVLNSKK